jgi:uncharacterized membrane protein YphA (DoxX/SURF4 family)
MQVIFVIGRIVFISLFAFTGAQKLMDIAGTASIISKKVTLPPALIGPASYIENAVGMAIPQIMAIASGALELFAALLIAFSIGVRPLSALLILYTGAVIFYMQDFWNMSGDARSTAILSAGESISIIGCLLMLFALGSSTPGSRSDASDSERL